MSREPLSRVVAAVAVVVAVVAGLALAGCSAVRPTSRGSVGSAGSGGSGGSDGSGGSGGSACSVEGFVPSTRLVTLRSTPVVLYGRAYTLAPASSVGFSGDMTRIEPVRLAVRVTRGGPVDASERDTILSRAGATVVDGDVAPTWPIRHRLANRTRDNQSYLFYRGAHALTGRWTARRCGPPYNDGAGPVRLSGTFRTVDAPHRLRLAVCGRAEGGGRGERGERGHGGVLAAKAARYACSA